MADNYLPRSDGDFFAWEQNFVAYVSGNLVALGLVAGDIVTLSDTQSEWEIARTDHTTKQAAAEAARQLKDNNRAAFEVAIRALVRRLQASPSVDDTERQAMGITVKDTQPTPVGAPVTKPVLQIGTANAQEHRISFADEGTPTSKAKPAGVSGVEIFAKKGGTPPAADADYVQIGYDTATPYLAVYDVADSGTTVYYRARWINTRGQKGPWSAMAQAKVPG